MNAGDRITRALMKIATCCHSGGTINIIFQTGVSDSCQYLQHRKRRLVLTRLGNIISYI